jgi:sarcosine oxidase delta subunit
MVNVNLGNFYKSKEWQKLLQNIKAERLNEDGELICAYCGKPIVKMYDCIGHHKIYLTDENVNDYDISLNPMNIDLVHHRCHNKIHNKFGHNKREVFLVYGSPFSGKSSYVESVRDDGDLIVDMDNIWQCVSGCDRYIKPARLNAVVFKLRDELLNAVKYRLGKWDNAYVIGGYPFEGERVRLCNELGAREIFINTEKDECIRRMMNSNDRDPEEWSKYIEDWWRKFAPLSPP